MNKVVIPAILVVIISIAGIFALAPIDKATTVHSTIVADLLATQTERDVVVNSLSNIGTTTIALVDISVDKDFLVEIGQFLVDSTSSAGTVIVEQIVIEDGAGLPFHVIEFTDETIVADTGRIVFPNNGTHATISMPATWSVVIQGKGGDASSDSKVMIGVIAADDATITVS